jgi:hypothetical protein
VCALCVAFVQVKMGVVVNLKYLTDQKPRPGFRRRISGESIACIINTKLQVLTKQNVNVERRFYLSQNPNIRRCCHMSFPLLRPAFPHSQSASSSMPTRALLVWHFLIDLTVVCFINHRALLPVVHPFDPLFTHQCFKGFIICYVQWLQLTSKAWNNR